MNRHLNSWRARLGLPYWSLSRCLQRKVERAVSCPGDFASAVARQARVRGVHDVVCGHIHHAEIRCIDGVLYCNDRDSVESATAPVKHPDSRLQNIDWSERMKAASPHMPATRRTLSDAAVQTAA